MSSSSPIDDSVKPAAASIAGAKMFSHTCNLLSQYVKEKRARGATINLFPVNGKQSEDSNGGSVGRTINLFSQLSGFPLKEPSSLMPNSCASKPGSPEPSPPQMTIFYAGQVVVINDLPADKAKEVMDLANSLEMSVKKRKAETTDSLPATPLPVSVAVPFPSTTHNPSLNALPNFGSNVTPATVLRPTARNVSDLPIARKASLHRFLEKRKDRLVGNAPTGSEVSSSGPSKPGMEGQPWLGLNSLPVFNPQHQN